jgi:3-hydroxybenzoate 6-monooxygenase
MGILQDRLPIVIAGGGLGGLTAALALAQRGFDVRLFERSNTFKEIGAGVQLGPNVFRVFERLGISEAVSCRTVFPDDLVMMDSLTGEVVTSIPVTGTFRRRFSYPYALIHRGDLQAVLLDQCAACSRIDLQTSQKVVGFVDEPEGVTVQFEGGRTCAAAGLVGADGIWSTIRQQLLDDGPPRRSGFVAYRSVLAAEEMPPNLRVNRMTLWAGPKNHLVHYPLRGHALYNVVAAFHSDRHIEGWNSPGDAHELQERFEPVVGIVKEMLNKISTWRMWVLCDRDPIARWSEGHVTLLGDAAHPMLQYLGQGAGMAFEDAAVLADELAAASGECITAFQAYQARRYLRAGRAQLTSRLYGEFFHAVGPSRDIRNVYLRARTEENAFDSLSWLYDGF